VGESPYTTAAKGQQLLDLSVPHRLAQTIPGRLSHLLKMAYYVAWRHGKKTHILDWQSVWFY